MTESPGTWLTAKAALSTTAPYRSKGREASVRAASRPSSWAGDETACQSPARSATVNGEDKAEEPRALTRRITRARPRHGVYMLWA